jgi:hypothetical protein
VLATYFKLVLLVTTLEDPNCDVILEQAAGPGSAANEPTGPKTPTRAKVKDIMIDMLNLDKAANRTNNWVDCSDNKKLDLLINRAHSYTSFHLRMAIHTKNTSAYLYDANTINGRNTMNSGDKPIKV